MFDWMAIYQRFSSEYGTDQPARLAKILGVTKQSTHDWKIGRSHVPWRRMKKLVDEKGLRWDWLLEGKKPKHHDRQKSALTEDFDWDGIRDRFFSLFPNQPQTAIANHLGVSQVTVSKWYRGEKHVPWEKLRHLVTMHRVTWNWVLEGT